MKLEQLIEQVVKTLEAMGYSERVLKDYRNEGFGYLQHFFEEQGVEEFSIELANEYIAEIQRLCDSGRFSHQYSNHLKKHAYWFIEVYETGTFQWGYGQKSKLVVNSYFEDLLYRYLDSISRERSFETIRGIKSEVLHFLHFLCCTKNYNNFSKVTLIDVQDFILATCQRRKRRIDKTICSTRNFLLFLKDNDIIKSNLATALYIPAQKSQKVLAIFTHDEINNIYNNQIETLLSVKGIMRFFFWAKILVCVEVTSPD